MTTVLQTAVPTTHALSSPFLCRLDTRTQEVLEKGLEDSLGDEGYAAWLQYREIQRLKRDRKALEDVDGNGGSIASTKATGTMQKATMEKVTMEKAAMAKVTMEKAAMAKVTMGTVMMLRYFHRSDPSQTITANPEDPPYPGGFQTTTRALKTSSTEPPPFLVQTP